MNKLYPRDLVVFPDWLKGEKPLIQLVYARIYSAELTGKPWNMAQLARECGSTGATVKSALEYLAERSLIVAQEDGKHPYAIVLDCVVIRAELPKTPRKVKAERPQWVDVLAREWMKEGFVSPSRMEQTFKDAVERHSPAVVLSAMRCYLDEYTGQEKRFRSVRNLAEHLSEWLPYAQDDAPPMARSAADVMGGSARP